MENSCNAQVSCLLEPLRRFEATSDSIQDRKKLVELFCLQVIPFIGRYVPILPLLEKLRADYGDLKDAIEVHKTNAVAECKKTFRQIERDLKSRSQLPEEIALSLKKTRSVLSKNQFGDNAYPIYRIYSDAVRGVLQLLFEAGFRDICAKHAELIEVDACIQIDPTQPEMEHVKTTQIRFFTFDPSSGKATAASKRVYWDQLHDPAIVWHYFESALWCWNTPGSYFEDKLSPSEREKDVSRFYQNQTEHAKWREISKLQGSVQDNNRIVVFTERLFKEGLKTLINAIAVFVAEGVYKVEAPPKVMEKATFELFWQWDQLWISARSSTCEEKFCLQKFKDSGHAGGSEQQKFCKKLVESSVDAQVPYQLLFDRMAHVLGRLNLPPILKKRYFGTAQKASVFYQGPKLQICLESSELMSIIQALQALHNPD